MGGLGIKKIEDMNKALVAKRCLGKLLKMLINCGWQFSKRNMWKKKKNFMKILMPKSASWSCQSIFGYRDVLKNGLCHRISNGLNT